MVEIVARGKDEAAILAGPGEASREVDVLHMFPKWPRIFEILLESKPLLL